jgi:hypothetical protein
MSDQPEFHFEVTGAEIAAALERHDYGWLVDNVFTPALAQFMRKKHTAALINNPRPRARRPTGTRRRTRSFKRFRPPSR